MSPRIDWFWPQATRIGSVDVARAIKNNRQIVMAETRTFSRDNRYLTDSAGMISIGHGIYLIYPSAILPDPLMPPNLILRFYEGDVMKKLTCLVFAALVATFSISAIGCGAGSAKDAKGNPDIEQAARDEVNKKREEMEGK